MRLQRVQVPTPSRGEGRTREPSTEHRAPYVMGKCGHVLVEWAMVKTLRSLAPEIYCETCIAWVKYGGRPTVGQLIGLDPPSGELPLEAPF